jgi:hypothetical protein
VLVFFEELVWKYSFAVMQEATAGWMAHNLCKITGMEYSHRSETKVWNKHMMKTEKETKKVRKNTGCSKK